MLEIQISSIDALVVRNFTYETEIWGGDLKTCH